MPFSHRKRLRSVMTLAWGLYRSDIAHGQRSFADALSGVWRFLKRLSEETASNTGSRKGRRSLSFGSKIVSPIDRRLHGKPYAGFYASRAGRLTSRLGE